MPTDTVQWGNGDWSRRNTTGTVRCIKLFYTYDTCASNETPIVQVQPERHSDFLVVKSRRLKEMKTLSAANDLESYLAGFAEERFGT